MGEQVKIEVDATLPSVGLFQATDGVLDLQRLNPPNPENVNDPGDPVVVSVLVPYGQTGEVIVWFGDKSQNFPVNDSKRAVQDVCFTKDRLPAPGQRYDVYYEFGGKRSEPVQIMLIDSGDRPPVVARHTCSLFGAYAKGVVASWVIPASRTLTSDDPVIRSVPGGSPSEGASLAVLWQSGASQPARIGEIVYGHNEWSITLDQEVMQLNRLDILALQASADRTFLNFSLDV
jgi:hypothetical protein